MRYTGPRNNAVGAGANSESRLLHCTIKYILWYFEIASILGFARGELVIDSGVLWTFACMKWLEVHQVLRSPILLLAAHECEIVRASVKKRGVDRPARLQEWLCEFCSDKSVFERFSSFVGYCRRLGEYSLQQRLILYEMPMLHEDFL